MSAESSESSDQESDNSDQDSSEYEWKDFVVVRAFVNNRDRYDCIPSSWLVFENGRGFLSTVEYRFPSLAQLGKGIKFRKNQKAKNTWPTYIGKMMLETDCKAEAFQYIKGDKEKTKRYYEEDGVSYSSSSELDSEEDNATKKQNNKKKQGTKRKQSEKKNTNIKKGKKLESEKIEVAKQLHSQCNNLSEDFNVTYQKSLSILDKTADFLQKIISAHKAKIPPSKPTK